MTLKELNEHEFEAFQADISGKFVRRVSTVSFRKFGNYILSH